MNPSLLSWLWDNTVAGTVLALLVALSIALFGKRLTPSWRYALWLLVAVRLMVPFVPSSSWSLLGWIAPSEVRSNGSPYSLFTPVVGALENSAAGESLAISDEEGSVSLNTTASAATTKSALNGWLLV